jgi:hypothetical protein
MGGSAFWDVNAACGRGTPYTTGHCDVSAARCSSDADCSGGSDHCRTPSDVVTAQLAPLINYITRSGGDPATACLKGGQTGGAPNPAFEASSLGHAGLHFDLHHPVHFVTDEDGPIRSEARDEGVMEGQTLYLVDALRAATDPSLAPRWSDFDGHYHCDSFGKDPTLTPWTVSTIKQEMGIQ